MSSPSPRKQSIQFSESPSPSHSRGPSPGPDQLRRLSECPTPHPNKLAGAAAYFDGGQEPVGGGGGLPPKPFLNRQPRPVEQPPIPRAASPPQAPKRAVLPRRSSTMDSEYFRDRMPFPRRPAPTQKYSDEKSTSAAASGSQPRPQRPGPGAMLRRSSTMDSEFFERNRFARKFSEVEEGHAPPTPKREHGKGVVAEIIQYGLRHGLGRLPSSVHVPRKGSIKLVSTQSLYERDPEAGEEKKTVEPAALGRRPTYVERCNNLRERKQSQIIYHVEGELALSAWLHGLAHAYVSQTT